MMNGCCFKLDRKTFPVLAYTRMNTLFKTIFGSSMLLFGCWSAVSALELDTCYGDHMVLQRGCPVTISGTATSSKPIQVTFGKQKVAAQMKGKKWRAKLAPMEANAEGQELTVTQGNESVTLRDVVVGEVWIASGQSNMLWRVNQTPGNQQTIAQSANDNLRFFHSEPKVHTNHAVYNEDLMTRLKENRMYEGNWAVSAPATTPRMSAVGYYFGQKLQELLGVPVGIIHCALGGSEMLAWVPEKVVRKKYKACLGDGWLESKYISEWVRGRARKNMGADPKSPHPYKPAYLFESGLAKWTGYPVAGAIWYQGESDAELQDMQQNTQLLTDLINSWRAEFKSPQMPFLMVQLPRINDNTPLRKFWPEFRTVQANVAAAMPGVECLTTVDLGSTNSDVHPPRKVEVGERLAALAAAKVYGKEVPFSGPAMVSCTPSGKEITVKFDHAAGLSTTDGQAPRHFEIAGSNGKFQPADARIEGDSVILSSDKVSAPKQARYAWATYLTPNLVNADKLPAVPFVYEGK